MHGDNCHIPSVFFAVVVPLRLVVQLVVFSTSFARSSPPGS